MTDTPPTIPASLQGPMQTLSNQLQTSLGNVLVSVVLYGPHAKGDVADGTGAGGGVVHVMIVLSQVSVQILDALAPAVRAGMKEYNLSPLVVTEHNLFRSTDVFPAKFMDIKRNHILLAGRDVLSNLQIETEHLRLRCEQELKNTTMRLRNFYLQGEATADTIKQTLAGSFKTIFDTLAAACGLKSGKKPVKKGAIAKVAAQELGLDHGTLQGLIAVQRGQAMSLPELKQLYNGTMQLVERAGDIVDAME